MRVETDMLDFATGGVLSMKYEDEKQRPVVYISKSLNKAERNYEIHNKQMFESMNIFLRKSQKLV